MTFFNMAQKQYNIDLPGQHRIYNIIPLNTGINLIIFKNLSFCIYCLQKQTSLYRGNFKQTYNRHIFTSSSTILLISDKLLTEFDFHKYIQSNYLIAIENLFSELHFFSNSRLIVEYSQSVEKQALQLRLFCVQRQSQQQSIVLGHIFTDPLLVKINQQNEFALLQKHNSDYFIRLYLISQKQFTIKQQKLLQLSKNHHIVKAYFIDQLLILFARIQNKPSMIYYRYSIQLNQIISSKSIQTQFALINEIHRMINNSFLLVMKKNSKGQTFYLLDFQGKIVCTHYTILSSLPIKVSSDQRSLIRQYNSNQKYFYKLKPDLPTVLRVKSYKLINKASHYIKLMKVMYPQYDESIMSHLLQLL